MVYSQFYLKNKIKVPVILSFLFIIFIILIFLRIFSGLSKPSSAVKKNIRRLEITNLFSSSVTIFWQTDKKENGWVIYGDSPKNMINVAFDERDIASQKNSYLNHYATIRNLKRNHQYFFAIISDNKLIINRNKKPFSFTTPTNDISIKNLDPAYGRVLKSNNTPLEGAVVLLGFDNKIFASAMTKSTGEWLIPLNFKNLKPTDKIKIEIIDEENHHSVIETLVNKASPLPKTIIIGDNYNFSEEEQVLSATSFFNEKKEIDIIYPKENALIPGRIPLIKGVALPNSVVFIIIKSFTTYSVRVKADSKGFWSFLPPKPLSLGKHTVTITTKNNQGKDITIERKFIIVGNEGSDAAILGEATPSSTIVPSPPSPSPSPSSRPSYPPSPSPLPTNQPPTPGNNIFMPIVTGVSFLIIGLGMILVF